MREPPTRARRGRLVRLGAAFVVLLALAGYLLVQYVSGGRTPPRCTVVSGRGDGPSYELTAEQAVNAATISAVGTSHGMPERAVTIALATALQESGLRNVDHGDRDSLGLFQQRPSQGWGTRRQIMDPAYASGRFYERLAEVPGYARLPLTVAAQRVQHSGYPRAYAKHEPDATLLAAALTGRAAASLTCEGRAEKAAPGSASKLHAALVRDFGPGILRAAGATAGPDRAAGTGTGDPAGTERPAAASKRTPPATADGGTGGTDGMTGSTTGGTTVSVPLRTTPASHGGSLRQRGWELAHWAVAHSSALHIDRVSYAGREWAAGAGGTGWRTVDPHGDAGSGRNAGSDGGARTDEVRIVTGQ